MRQFSSFPLAESTPRESASAEYDIARLGSINKIGIIVKTIYQREYIVMFVIYRILKNNNVRNVLQS